MTRALLLALVAMFGAACTENASFDLDIELPASDAMIGSRPIGAVTVQFATDTTDFMSSWEGDVPQTTVDLGATRQTLRLSVLAQPAQITRPLAVRVLYCETRAKCEAAPATPLTEQHVVIPRAFYTGVVTRYRLDASSPPASPPTTPMEVDRCDIAGCRDGEMATWCSAGIHLCEQ